jgi:hypothetical protein
MIFTSSLHFIWPAAFLLDTGGVLQILSEMSWDTLLLLVGLAFIAIAVVGNISGKIAPGKEGRIAAAALGCCLVAGGFWYHSVLHSFRVTGLAITSPGSQSGKCPFSIPLQAVADVSGSGDLIYNFQFSTGNGSELQHVTYSQSGSQILSGAWQVQKSMPDAWIQLNIAAPAKQLSQPSGHFSVLCDASVASVGQAERPHQAAPPAGLHPAPQAPQAPPSSTPQKPPTQSHTLNPAANSVVLLSASPASGTYLKRGTPIPFNIVVDYNLVSADSAILSISSAQMSSSSAGCAGGGELSDAVEVPIQRGTHRTSAKLIWSGDTGLATKGRIYGSGYVSFIPMFWASNNGQRTQRIASFDVYKEFCYRFGP